MLAAVGASAVAGCSGGPDPNALTLWAMSYEGDYSPHLTAAFTRATGIPVDVQSLPWTAAHEKLLTAHAGGMLPDVFMIPNGWTGEFVTLGALAPVADPRLVADLFPGTRDLTRHAGRDYAVPWSVAPQGQFYRRDILAAAGYERPPADWDSWRRMGLALKRRRPDDFVVLMYLNWWDALFTFAGQTGPVLRDRNTRGAFATPVFKEALGFYKSLFDDELAPRAMSTEIQDPVSAFAQGYFALYPSGPSLLRDFKRREGELPAQLWASARMPGPHGPAPASAVSSALGVAATSRRSADAWRLVAHLTSAESELTFQQMIGNLPARVSAWSDPRLASPMVAPFAEQMRQPGHDPNLIEWERVRTEVQLIAERVVRGMMTISEGVAEMDRRTDLILAKRRALVEAGRIA